MDLLLFVGVLTALAVLASRFGADSRDGLLVKERELAAWGVNWANLAEAQPPVAASSAYPGTKLPEPAQAAALTPGHPCSSRRKSMAMKRQVKRVHGADLRGNAPHPVLAGRHRKQPVLLKRQGLAALLALGLFLGTAAPGLAAGSVGSSGAGNDYPQPRASASER